MTETTRSYERFSLARRIEHLIMLLSFSTLGLTGLPQKYPLNNFSQAVVLMFGGIENLRSVHHVAAIIMVIGTVYHIVILGYKLYVDRIQLTMLPTLQDAKDGIQAFLYNLGLGKHRPQMGRYTFEEKMEYWAFVWGALVMVATGFIMWNPIAATRFLPGEFIPASKAAHGGEAVLAVLAIILWHFYGVHLKLFNKSMWTGKMSEEEMLHEHPLELADVKAGKDKVYYPASVLNKRRFVYLPVALILTGLGLYAVYSFVTMEVTAIDTLPDAVPGPAYLPQTATPEPSPTPAIQSVDLTWESVVGPMLQQKCIGCHMPNGAAGLDLSTYAGIMNGGKKGPVITINDSANSRLVIIQSAGGHPGQLSAEELGRIKTWIDSGALEK